MFFTFPESARWDPDRQAAEFGVEIGEYQGVVRLSRAQCRQRLRVAALAIALEVAEETGSPVMAHPGPPASEPA
jgi:hypothetical protein